MTRRLATTLVLGLALAGCASSVVYRDPATGEVVDCTALAQRLTSPATRPGADWVSASGGSLGVPYRYDSWPRGSSFDIERQCAGQLRRDGWTCLSGCE